ncbi:MAG: class I SAM-dependent rRNA methyltransferase [Phycisphaerae bacterium]|nr:class I SAM-dependent rRNA methyltransferase [Phycisphaerae bacterium]
MQGSSDSPPAHAGAGPWVRLRSGTAHPFIYRRMIASVDPAAKPGDVVTVYGKGGELFGHGFWHDRSQIALRMLNWDATPIDDAFFRGRLEQAVRWRERLLAGQDTNVCRLVHAEGDGLSGLIAERYDDVIVIEVFALAIFRRLEMLQRLLTELTGITRFAVRADERIERLEGFRIPLHAGDELPPTLTVRENGLRFRVDVRTGHKTGFFCDQRENRRRLAGFCAGAEVLDVCCYTGGFGVYAATHGHAATVSGVDLDEDAVAMATKNAHLNDARIQHVHADAFSYLRQMQTNGRGYDVIVLDPPKFVANREEFHDGSHKYVDLNALAMSVLRPGGVLLTCSCSGTVGRDDFIGMVKAAANRVRRSLQIVDQTGAAPDHPIMANCPESGYLKAVWARVG